MGNTSVEAVFAAVDADKDEVIGESDFLQFFEGREECSFDADKLERLFVRFVDNEAAATLSKAAFFQLIRLHFKVVKETLLTTEMAVKEGKAIRRLDVDEVIAVHEGPHKDPNLGITRLRGCTVKDGLAGWATTTGNTGGVFLEECGSDFE